MSRFYKNELKGEELISKQKEICLKYGADFLSSPLNATMGIALDTFEKKLTPINGLRHPSTKCGDSGWYLWAGEYSPESDFFKPVHVEHILEICPKALEYLGLAPGWRFLINNDNYKDVWFDIALFDI